MSSFERTTPPIASHPNATMNPPVTPDGLSEPGHHRVVRPIRAEVVLMRAEGERNLEDWRSPAQKTCVALGIVFLLIGAWGFASPGFLGHHLSPAHNLIHLASGALSLAYGLQGSVRRARTFCFAFGAVYGALGVAGLLFGAPGVSSVMPEMGLEPLLLVLIPGRLELGTNDHWLHVILSGIFVASAAFMRIPFRATEEAARAYARRRESQTQGSE